MKYHTIAKMVGSKGLRDRLVGAAALEGRADAPMWVEQNIYRLVNVASAIEAWEAAETQQAAINADGDIGRRTDVINDAGIVARVRSVITEDTPAEEPAGP